MNESADKITRLKKQALGPESDPESLFELATISKRTSDRAMVAISYQKLLEQLNQLSPDQIDMLTPKLTTEQIWQFLRMKGYNIDDIPDRFMENVQRKFIENGEEIPLNVVKRYIEQIPYRSNRGGSYDRFPSISKTAIGEMVFENALGQLYVHEYQDFDAEINPTEGDIFCQAYYFIPSGEIKLKEVCNFLYTHGR